MSYFPFVKQLVGKTCNESITRAKVPYNLCVKVPLNAIVSRTTLSHSVNPTRPFSTGGFLRRCKYAVCVKVGVLNLDCYAYLIIILRL